MDDLREDCEWAEYGWDPLDDMAYPCNHCAETDVNRCFNGCKKRGGLMTRYHPKRYFEPACLELPSRIVVGRKGEIGHAGDDAVRRIIRGCRETPRHRYFFLSRFPECYSGHKYPDNCWLGAIAFCAGDGVCVDRLRESAGKNHAFVLLKNIPFDMDMISLSAIEWVVLDTSCFGGFPDPRNYRRLAERCRGLRIPFFVNSRFSPFAKDSMPQEFPDILKRPTIKRCLSRQPLLFDLPVMSEKEVMSTRV